MSTTTASERARDAARARWAPSPVVLRAARVLLERADELPPETRAEVHEATEEDSDG